MPRDKTLYLFVYLGWNVVVIEDQSCTILQQQTQFMKGYKLGCFLNNSRNGNKLHM
jgi:hypothetical protein